MLHAWTTFLAIQDVFEAWSESSGWVPHRWMAFYFIMFMIAFEILAIGYAYATPEGDVIAGITLTWALFGVLRGALTFC